MGPKKQEKTFAPKYAKELFNIAKGDFDTAVAISKSENVRLENAFFMAQQAIEKALKALLVSHEVSVPLVHDLGALLAKIPDSLDPPYGYELNDLNQYATIRRYEEGSYQVSNEELQTVLTKTSEILNWVENNIRSQ